MIKIQMFKTFLSCHPALSYERAGSSRRCMEYYILRSLCSLDFYPDVTSWGFANAQNDIV